MTLDAQTVRAIVQRLRDHASLDSTRRMGGMDTVAVLLEAADALAGLVASVEALTEKLVREEGVVRSTMIRAEAAEARVVALTAERDAYRIDADCAMRDCDALDLRLGIAVDALRKIEDRRQGNGATPRGLAAIARAALDAEAALPDAERKQELGGDGLGAVTVAQETTAGVAPLRPLHERVTRVADWLEWPPHGTFRRGRGVAQFKIRDLREAANALAASATSPAHRRGAPEDALSPEEERDALAEMLEGAYEDCERAEARLLSLEEALREARNAKPKITYSNDSDQAARYWKDCYEQLIAGVDAALAASVGDKERKGEGLGGSEAARSAGEPTGDGFGDGGVVS